MSWQPGLAERLLAKHVAASDGKCRGCTKAGQGTPEAPWPCSIRNLAVAAMAHRDQHEAQRLQEMEETELIWSQTTGALPK